MLTTYTLDGTRTRFTFDWPYLDRSHIMVTVDLAARPFKFISDHEIEVKSLFGEPLPEGKLKIFRVTPDLISLAEFKDAANLTALDLNRSRLQCLFLIQERSGGLGGSVAGVVQLLVNEIETLSGALDTLQFSQGVITAGLQTLDELGSKIETAVNEGGALRDLIDQTIEDNAADMLALNTRVDNVEASQGNLMASVNTSINTLVTSTMAQASRVDSLEAKVDAIETDGGDEDEGGAVEALSASLIQAAVASVKNGVAQAKRIESLEAKVGEDIQALIQTEQEVRAAADAAMASQIVTLQAAIDGDLAQLVEEMKVTNDKVTGLNAQWTMKAQVQREDGSPVFAGIGLAATANNEITKSEIVMQADRLVFVAADNLNAPPKPIFEAGLVDGSPTFIIPANRMGDRAYPGRLLVDGSIEGRSVAANTITGDKLKAGSISAREIDVSLGTNILQNTEFADNNGTIPANWGIDGPTWSGSWGISHGIDMSGWGLTGGHTYWARQTATNGDQNIEGAYAALNGGWQPALAGTRYEFSVYTGAHRCKVQVQLVFADGAGNWLLVSTVDGNAINNRETGGGTALFQYKRIGGFATAPAGTTRCLLWIRKGLHNNGEADSYMFITRPMVAEALPNQTRLSPYGISGLGTKITPGGITTPSLSALSGVIGVLRTATAGARMEIRDNVIFGFDANNVKRFQIGNLDL